MSLVGNGTDDAVTSVGGVGGITSMSMDGIDAETSKSAEGNGEDMTISDVGNDDTVTTMYMLPVSIGGRDSEASLICSGNKNSNSTLMVSWGGGSES